MKPFLSTVALIALAGLPGLAFAQPAAQPDPKFLSTFSAATQRFMCAPDQSVLVPPMLGELAKNFFVNLFALPPAPPLDGAAVPTTTEARFAGWIIASGEYGDADATRLGLTVEQLTALQTIRYELVDYLIWLGRSPSHPAYRIDAASIGAVGSGAQRNAVLRRLFAPVLSQPSASTLSVHCVPQPPATQVANRDGHTAPPIAQPPLTIAVRGHIDDLAIPRYSPGTTTLSPAFGKASDATLAYTDNDVKGEENVAVEGVIGLGYTLTRSDSFFAFLHYIQSTTETDVVGDDDDAKDVRALSPGILYRRSVGSPGLPFYGSFGLTAYPTFDLAQDSRILRGRVFLSDISLNLPRGPVCDIAARAGPLQWNCRLGVFAEYASVLEAGRSTDLATLDDDQYFGIGGEASLFLSLPGVPALAPFQLSAEYRYMGIVSGALDDPHRLTLSFSYKIPASNIAISLSHVRGANFETFQPERLTKLSIGFRY